MTLFLLAQDNMFDNLLLYRVIYWYFLLRKEKSIFTNFESYLWICEFKCFGISALAWNLFGHFGHWYGHISWGRWLNMCFWIAFLEVNILPHFSGHSKKALLLCALPIWLSNDFDLLYFFPHRLHSCKVGSSFIFMIGFMFSSPILLHGRLLCVHHSFDNFSLLFFVLLG